MTPETAWSDQVAACADRTQQILLGAGWTATRQIDISAYVQELEVAEYSVFPIVQAFLRAFGGLHIRFTIFDAPTGRNLHTDIRLDPSAALASIGDEGISDYVEILGTPLCPIGQAEHDHFLLFMDPQGRVYGMFDPLIVLYGETGVQAIDALIMRKDVPTLYEP